jgi:hypothetical protein
MFSNWLKKIKLNWNWEFWWSQKCLTLTHKHTKRHTYRETHTHTHTYVHMVRLFFSCENSLQVSRLLLRNCHHQVLRRCCGVDKPNYCSTSCTCKLQKAQSRFQFFFKQLSFDWGEAEISNLFIRFNILVMSSCCCCCWCWCWCCWCWDSSSTWLEVYRNLT